jgi:predicted SprT family Zn-dependent metalloprotease
VAPECPLWHGREGFRLEQHAGDKRPVCAFVNVLRQCQRWRCAVSERVRPMKKDDVTCTRCKASFRRLELLSDLSRTKGEYRCPVCDEVLETFNGQKWIAYRLTVAPLSWLPADSNSL